MTVTLIMGKEQVSIQRKMNELSSDRATHLFAGDVATGSLISAMQNNSLFGSGETQVLRELSQDQDASEHLVELLSAGGEGLNDILVVDSSIKKNSRLYKAIKAHGEVFEYSTPKPYELGRWVVEYVKSKTASISVNDANFMVTYLGSDTGILASEIDKLLLVDAAGITKEMIETYCAPSPEATVFELLDAIAAGDTAKAEQRAGILFGQKREEPRKVHAMIAWQVLNWATVATLLDSSDTEITASSKISPYVLKKTRQQLPRDKRQARHLSRKLNDVLLDTESLLNIDFADAEQAVLLEIAQLTSIFSEKN